jgi:hypothetical protein
VAGPQHGLALVGLFPSHHVSGYSAFKSSLSQMAGPFGLA